MEGFMKKREGNGLRWGLICFTGIIFAMMVMVIPAIAANECGEVSERTVDGVGFIGSNNAAPYTKSQNFDVVTDSNGLMWESDGSLSIDETQTWASACLRCDQLVLAGKDDWRLPTVEELESIVNRKMSPTTINAEFTALEGLYWTKSVLSGSGFENNVFVVSFDNGETSITDKALTMFSRCVTDNSSQNHELTIEWDIIHYKGSIATIGTDGVPAYLVSESDPDANKVNALGALPSLPLVQRGTTDTDSIIFKVTDILDSKGDSIGAIEPSTNVDYFWTVAGPQTYTMITSGGTFTPKLASILNGLKAGTSGQIPVGTYTVTLEVWDHSNPNRRYGIESVTFTICDGDCKDNYELCEYEKGATYINQDLTLTLKSLFYQDKEDKPKIKLEMPNLELKLVPDPVGNRVLFALQLKEFSNPLDKDSDGYTTDGNNGKGIDCDDDNPMINPGATEQYRNGIDEDCTPTVFD